MKYLLIFLFFITTNAFAYGDRASERLLSVGAGIAAPSFSSALFENPAGLVMNDHLKILGAAESGSNSFDPRGYQELLFLGNGTVGGSIGAEELAGTRLGGNTALLFGLATEIPSMGLDLGFSGAYQSGVGTGIDLGLIWKIQNAGRIGFTVFDAFNGAAAYAAGVAYDVTPSSTLAVDGSADRHFNGKTVKPGIEIQLREFQLSGGYGIKIDQSSSWIERGASLGLGVRLSEPLHLQAYYNQLAKYYLGISVKI